MIERLAQSLAVQVSQFSAESRMMGWGRTIIALAQASILVFTPTSYLFVPVGAHDGRPNCDSIQNLSAFCMAGGQHLQIVGWLVCALLLVIATGILPRYFSVLHFWIAISINQSISLPDGGEAAAQAVTFFVMIASINDRRWFHWTRGTRRHCDSVLQGVAWAGSWGLRGQVAYIYLNSSLAKLAVEPWQDGTATYYVARMESFGAAGIAGDLVREVTALPWFALAATWGTILLEFMIAWFVLTGGRRHPIALVVATALHISIIIQLGIVSFGLIMIGCVTCAASSGIEGTTGGRTQGRPEPSPSDQPAEREVSVPTSEGVPDTQPTPTHPVRSP